ncbi:hypothetical protein LIA77_09782 [Sarocladium implicatum]|nr:hypothetical protein LIA77_09782 [Sarocladium implicatum]
MSVSVQSTVFLEPLAARSRTAPIREPVVSWPAVGREAIKCSPQHHHCVKSPALAHLGSRENTLQISLTRLSYSPLSPDLTVGGEADHGARPALGIPPQPPSPSPPRTALTRHRRCPKKIYSATRLAWNVPSTCIAGHPAALN